MSYAFVAVIFFFWKPLPLETGKDLVGLYMEFQLILN